MMKRLFLLLLILTGFAATAQNTERFKKEYEEAYNLYKKGNVKESLTAYKNIIKADSTQYLAYVYGYETLVEIGKSKDAKSLLDLCYYTNINNCEVITGFIDQLYMFRYIDYSNEYIFFYNDKIDKCTDTLKADLYMIKGRYYSSLLKYDTMLYFYKQAYNLLPSDQYVINALATSYGQAKQIEEAVKYFKILNNKYPDWLLSYNNFGFVYTSNDMYNSAIEVFNKGIKVYNKNKKKYKYDTATASFLYNNRGEAKANLGDEKGALKDYNQAIKMWGRDSYVFRNRAKLYIKQGKINEACTDLYKASALSFTEMYGPEVDELLKKNCK